MRLCNGLIIAVATTAFPGSASEKKLACDIPTCSLRDVSELEQITFHCHQKNQRDDDTETQEWRNVMEKCCIKRCLWPRCQFFPRCKGLSSPIPASNACQMVSDENWDNYKNCCSNCCMKSDVHHCYYTKDYK